ncbi:hypothetical protein LG202_08860 [Methylobacillus methanolivorans]
MDIVQRVIVAILFLVVGIAQAATEQIEAKYRWSVNVSGSNAGFHVTAQLACDSYGSTHADNQNASAPTAHKTYAYTGIQAVNNETYLCLVKNQLNVDASFTVNRQWSCDNTTWNSGNNKKYYCTVPACVPPEVRKPDGSCGPPVNCQQGRILESGPFADTDGDGALPPLACIRGCYAHLTNGGGAPEMDCSIGGAGTIGVCSYVLPGDYIDQGESCSPDNSPTKTPPADRGPCPACDCMKSGGSWGQVNGVDRCMPKGTPGTLPVQTKPAPTIKEDKPKPTPENPNPDPTKTVTPSPTVTVIPNPNGGEPTVKEETTNPDGSTTTTTTGMGEYCKNNATSSTCKSTGTGNGGSGGGDFRGSCESGFLCSGDGVQCAIAKKIHQSRCDDLAELKQFNPAAEEGRRILMGEQDEDVQNWMNKEGDSKRTINLANEIKESGEYQFSAQCWSDLTVNIMGAAFTLPLSKLCSLFEMLGFALLAASYLWALRIVGIW